MRRLRKNPPTMAASIIIIFVSVGLSLNFLCSFMVFVFSPFKTLYLYAGVDINVSMF